MAMATRTLVHTWLSDPEALPVEVLTGLSDADWSALTRELIEGLPSPGPVGEQLHLLIHLKRLCDLRTPLPDQPALRAMRQRFVSRLVDTEPERGPIAAAVDALTANPPEPPDPAGPSLPSTSSASDVDNEDADADWRHHGESDSKRKRKRAPKGRQRIGFDETLLERWRNIDITHGRRYLRRHTAGGDDSYPEDLDLPEEHGADGAPPLEEPQRVHVDQPAAEESNEPPVSAKRSARRWLVDIEGLGETRSLTVGADYVVSIAVGSKEQPHLASGPYAQRAHRGRGPLDLTVQVTSTDFDVRTNPVQPLVVPTNGSSPTPARFVVGSRHPGECTLTAAVHCDGNFVTLLHFTVSVGRTISAALTVVGRPPEGLWTLEPRDISLTLERMGAGYRCHVMVDGAASPPANLTITPEALSMEVDALQQSLLDVVKTLDENGAEVFQEGLRISPQQEQIALRDMAYAGERLFRELFFGEQSGADSHELGNCLRQTATDAKALLTLQVVDNEAPIPWAVLYTGDVDDQARLSWDNFLGLRHQIEQVPLVPLDASRPRELKSRPSLAVGVNINLHIAEKLLAEVAAHQEQWVSITKQRTRLKVVTRNSQADVATSLADKKNAEQIVYFYCHAKSAGTDGDTGKATLTMEPNRPMTLNDLKRNAGRDLKLKGHPIVFINACDSADLSPRFYTGFVPYFMSRGARGVIGTQCKTPARFAIRFAELFFGRLFDGSTVGQSMLATRRDMLDMYRNPLGLLYATHCVIGARITPPLPKRKK